MYQRSYDWRTDVPYDDAVHLRCKYYIKAGDSLPGRSDGFIFVQLEQYGFDEDVFVIIQPAGKFENYLASSTSDTQVYKSRFGK